MNKSLTAVFRFCIFHRGLQQALHKPKKTFSSKCDPFGIWLETLAFYECMQYHYAMNPELFLHQTQFLSIFRFSFLSVRVCNIVKGLYPNAMAKPNSEKWICIYESKKVFSNLLLEWFSWRHVQTFDLMLRRHCRSPELTQATSFQFNSQLRATFIRATFIRATSWTNKNKCRH